MRAAVITVSDSCFRGQRVDVSGPAVAPPLHRLGRLVWKVFHQGAGYVEQGQETNPAAKKRRVQKMTKALRKLGYAVALTPIQEPGRG